jgi:anaerobic ribonucleoside-triphosphate reductase activating protein
MSLSVEATLFFRWRALRNWRDARMETNKTIWCYTGYTYEQIIASPKLSQILPYIDVLIDGPYIEALKDESLRFRGSSNQRVINI